jgi:hypothetical protein
VLVTSSAAPALAAGKAIATINATMLRRKSGGMNGLLYEKCKGLRNGRANWNQWFM